METGFIANAETRIDFCQEGNGFVLKLVTSIMVHLGKQGKKVSILLPYSSISNALYHMGLSLPDNFGLGEVAESVSEFCSGIDEILRQKRVLVSVHEHGLTKYTVEHIVDWDRSTGTGKMFEVRN